MASTLVAAALLQLSTNAAAQSLITLNGSGSLRFSPLGPPRFYLVGTGPELGRYLCHGEVNFQDGAQPGSLLGSGVAVFETLNGDMLVGEVFWSIAPDGGGVVTFSWRDYVRFSNGAVFVNTGRFRRFRPPGAVSPLKTQQKGLGIIAILIGL